MIDRISKGKVGWENILSKGNGPETQDECPARGVYVVVPSLAAFRGPQSQGREEPPSPLLAPGFQEGWVPARVGSYHQALAYCRRAETLAGVARLLLF